MLLKYLLDKRYWVKILTDSLYWGLATFIAYWLRIEGDIVNHLGEISIVALSVFPLKLFSIYIFVHHRRSWQYSSIRDLFSLAKSVGAVSTIYFLTAIVAREFIFLPLSVPVIEGIIAFLGLGAIRFFVRVYLREHYQSPKKKKEYKKVLIAGAGDSGTMIAREMLRHPKTGLVPIAFLDDALAKWKQKIMGIPVAGRVSEMSEIATSYGADELIIAMPSETGDTIRRVVEEARKCDLPHRIIPGFHDLISGRVSINQLRKVDVEDLLRRKPVQLDTQKIKSYVKGRRILVTGAGGSIGSEIVRQVSRFEPESIILLGRGENSIYHIVREMNADFSHIKKHIKIADVRDIDTLEKIFEEIQPEVIFHAAAHKHVPLMEQNPAQAIFNNVGGTKNLTNLALDFGVKYFVNISTDKAVNPTSVMGASKRIAEYVVQNASKKAASDQYFVSVRFGNVLGSRGSVIPVFKEQIRKGGPVTVTHPEMIRYFMTIPEASQLVLQAGALNQNGSVFVLDMGEPVKILDMAKDLIRLSGLEPEKDIKIKFSGIRPGEKLFEELLTSEEGTDITNFEKIMVARKNGMSERFESKLDRLFETTRQGNPQAIRSMIYELVPTFKGFRKQEAGGKVKN
ncbi:polysaccharide biosynthesis protein [Gracilimonas tropica]|uniref:polysaccharide biosynthesis protein n=1 Tax=Gracilimonas tropica TaxID=454600 RepID=UPI000366CC6A|nr:nucleoside-diphosphate sugar epimerase/dehydratase [Gracilimonas tropica]